MNIRDFSERVVTATKKATPFFVLNGVVFSVYKRDGGIAVLVRKVRLQDQKFFLDNYSYLEQVSFDVLSADQAAKHIASVVSGITNSIPSALKEWVEGDMNRSYQDPSLQKRALNFRQSPDDWRGSLDV